MDNNFLVRQIAQYPRLKVPFPGSIMLLQSGEAGSPYNSVSVLDFLFGALENGGYIRFAPQVGGIAWNGATLTWNNGVFAFSETLWAPVINTGNPPQQVATIAYVDAVRDGIRAASVFSFNFRKGEVQLIADDILRAGGAPIRDPHFGGWVTAPTIWDVNRADDTVATTAWVQGALINAVNTGQVVGSFNGRSGAVVLEAADISAALTAVGVYGYANTPPMGDASGKIATALFVDNAVEDVRSWAEATFETQEAASLLAYAPLNSPQFTGTPSAPTPAQTNNSGQLATTAFVHQAIVASTTGVASWNGRTGAVTMTAADVTAAGGAPLASPAFTGVPTAPTAGIGTSTTQIATTAYVEAALATLPIGVASFNTRTGAVTLTIGDVTAVGGAPIASPAFSGVPTVPTAAPAVSNTQAASTAYVTAALAALPAPVTSFNGRTGAVSFQASDLSAVGGALLASPNFTGTPTAPTPVLGNNSTEVATTAFVQAAVTGAVSGVASFNTRTGAVTLQAADLTGVGGALLASPAFSGIPTVPTAGPGTNTTQAASTAYVTAAIAALSTGVSSFNSRTGAVTLSGADVSAAGGALTASPAFSGTPTAPTAAPGTNSATLATTQFVTAAVQAAGGVQSFNGRSGVVTLAATDLTNAGGALLAGPTFTGVPAGPTAAPGTNSTQLATTAFVQAAAAANAGVVSFNTRAGAVVLTTADVTAAGGAPLASPTFTGAPSAPTPAPGSNSTVLATTAFVANAIATAGGVTSFNGRAGPVTLTGADITGAGGALLASPAFSGIPTVPTAGAGTSTTQAASTAFVGNAIGAAAAGTAFAYVYCTMNPTPLAVGATSATNPATGVLTWATPHGITTGQFCTLTGAAPTGLTGNTGYYLRALSPTTAALYLLQSDAYADTNRVTFSGAGTMISLRQFLVQNLLNHNFDANCPVGGWTARGGIYPELNLSQPLAGLFAVVVVALINGLYNNAATPTQSNVWSSGVAPTIVSTRLIRYDQTGSLRDVFTNQGLGAWSAQGATPFTVGFVVFGF